MDEIDELNVLLTLAKSGDTVATNRLFERLRKCAKDRAGYERGRQIQVEDASDLAQDAIARIVPHFNPNEFESAQHLVAWLNKIVRATNIDSYRRNTAQSRDSGRNVGGDDNFAGLASDTTGPELQAERHEAEARFRAALSEQERRVMHLDQQGIPDQVIAATLALTVENVRTIRSRASQKLGTLAHEDPS